jgi:hypothetical protein
MMGMEFYPAAASALAGMHVVGIVVLMIVSAWWFGAHRAN